MKLAYISDQVFYRYRDTWYTTASLPLTDLVRPFGPEVTHWLMFGRLAVLEEEPTALYPIEPPPGLTVEYVGVRLRGRGLAAHLLGLWPYFRAARATLRQVDIAWLKLPFLASYLTALLPRRQGQFWLTHQVGDPHLAITATLGQRYRLVAELARLATRWAVRRADLALFVSENLRAKYGAGHPHAEVVNESRVSRSQMASRPKEQPTQPLRVISMGRLSPEKNLDVLIGAIRVLKGRTEAVRLEIIGDGVQRAALADLIAQAGLQEQVTLRGSLPWGPVLFAALREGHVFVLPSRTEGMPLVLVEAMAQGLPCVGSRVGGIPEIIADGVNGRLVPPGAVEELADAILWTGDPARYADLSRAALQTAERYSFESQLDRLAAYVRRTSPERGRS